MFITRLKTALVEAVRRTFDAEYVEEDFRNLHVSIEYPVERQHYPGIWIDFDIEGQLETAGIDHREFTEESADGSSRRVMRWRFQGYASMTVVAMTSFERDRLFDEVVRVLAFGPESVQTAEFRAYIEDNEFLALNIDFDQIGVAGASSLPGTPWGTDEVIYEVTLRMECLGEFVSDVASGTLVPLAKVVTYPYVEGTDPIPAATVTPSVGVGGPADEPALAAADNDRWL